MGIDFKETAINNIDGKKFKSNHVKIFGVRERINCIKCDLSSRQKQGEAFTCPHCNEENK